MADFSDNLTILALDKLLMWLNINELIKNVDAKTYVFSWVLAFTENW